MRFEYIENSTDCVLLKNLRMELAHAQPPPPFHFILFHCCFSAASFRLRWDASIWREEEGRAGGGWLLPPLLLLLLSGPWIERCAGECRHFGAPVNAQTGPWYVRSSQTLTRHCCSCLCRCRIPRPLLPIASSFSLVNSTRQLVQIENDVGLGFVLGRPPHLPPLPLLYSNWIITGYRLVTETKQKRLPSSSTSSATLSWWSWLFLRLERNKFLPPNIFFLVLFGFFFFAVVGLLAVCGGLFLFISWLNNKITKLEAARKEKKGGKKRLCIFEGIGTTCWVALLLLVVDGSRWPLRRSWRCPPSNLNVDWACFWPLFSLCFPFCDDGGFQLDRRNPPAGRHSRWVLYFSSPIHSILVSPSCRSKVQQTVAYSPSWLKPRVAQHRALAQIIKMYTLANRISWLLEY